MFCQTATPPNTGHGAGRRRICLSTLGGLLILSPLNTFALDLDFVPRVSLGAAHSDIHLSQKWADPDINIPDTRFETTFALADLGITLSANQRLFIDLGAKLSNDSNHLQDRPGFAPDSKTRYQGQNIAVGIRLYQGLRLFAGGFNEETMLDSVNRRNLRYQGGYIGVGNGFSVGKSSVISLHGALGYSEGRIGVMLADGSGLDVDLRSRGINSFSAGIAWNGRISTNVSYSLSLDNLHNRLDDWRMNGQSYPGTLSQDVTLLRLTLRENSL